MNDSVPHVLTMELKKTPSPLLLLGLLLLLHSFPPLAAATQALEESLENPVNLKAHRCHDFSFVPLAETGGYKIILSVDGKLPRTCSLAQDIRWDLFLNEESEKNTLSIQS